MPVWRREHYVLAAMWAKGNSFGERGLGGLNVCFELRASRQAVSSRTSPRSWFRNLQRLLICSPCWECPLERTGRFVPGGVVPGFSNSSARSMANGGKRRRRIYLRRYPPRRAASRPLRFLAIPHSMLCCPLCASLLTVPSGEFFAPKRKTVQGLQKSCKWSWIPAPPTTTRWTSC